LVGNPIFVIIEAKYSPKKWAAVVGGTLSTAASASMFFMPVLAAASDLTAPVVSVQPV